MTEEQNQETQTSPLADKQPQTDDKSKPATQNSNSQTNATLAYLAGWITGLIFLLTEKNDDYIRFHAAQSLVVFGFLNLLMFIPIINIFLVPILGPVTLVLWVLLMVMAYQGKRFKFPVAGDFAEQLKDKIGK